MIFFDDVDFNILDNVETIDILENIETMDIPENIETINIVDIEIPSDDRLANDAPKKIKIINKRKSLRIASNKGKKKYICQKSKGL